MVITGEYHVAVQRGPHMSTWIRIQEHNDEQLEQFLRHLEPEQKIGAIYCCITDTVAQNAFFKRMSERGYKFHHYIKETNELVYYKWFSAQNIPDMVPSYASSIEGAMAITLSPDESHVLVVWEHNNWKGPTGAVDEGESLISAVKREVHEEVQIELDESFATLLTAGWNQPMSRDKTINDHFYCFLLKAKSLNFTVDGNEIQQARWAPLQEFEEVNTHGTVQSAQILYNDVKYSRLLVQSVINWKNGRYLTCSSGQFRQYPQARWFFL